MKQYFYLVILLLWQNSSALGSPLCSSETTPKQAIEFCESMDEITIKIGEENRIYQKEEFNLLVQQQIESWLKTTKFPPNSLCNSQIEYWFSIPDSNPLATQARVAVLNPHKNFLLYLDPFPESWEISASNATIMDKEVYPNTYGYTSSKILIKTQPNTSKELLDHHMSKYLAVYDDSISKIWHSYSIPTFTESSTRDKIKSDLTSPLFIDEIEYDTVFEWISTKELAYNFAWTCNSPSE